MSPAALVGSLRRRGVLLAPAGDGRLRYHPREALSGPTASSWPATAPRSLPCSRPIRSAGGPPSWPPRCAGPSLCQSSSLGRASGSRPVLAALAETRSIAMSGIAAAPAWQPRSESWRPSRQPVHGRERPADGIVTGASSGPVQAAGRPPGSSPGPQGPCLTALSGSWPRACCASRSAAHASRRSPRTEQSS